MFVFIYLITALTWAETCSSTHSQVVINTKACVVLDGKTEPCLIEDKNGMISIKET